MSQKILYLECNSGISGDMTVGALLDLGADRKVLEEGLASLPLSGYTVKITDVFKSGLRACDFNVILEQDNFDHDMEYLHGTGHSSLSAESLQDSRETAEADQDHPHVFAHEHHQETSGCAHRQETPSHRHGHGEDPHAHLPEAAPHTHLPEAAPHAHLHETTPHTHHQGARGLRDILRILEQGKLTRGALVLAVRIFTILAEAEARVHGKSIEEIHFHEVGAVDSIVDIAAAAICIDNLKPDLTIVSALTDGTGMIRCQHGLIPVPVPAVSAIVSTHGLPLRIRPIEGELVTPTGAAIAAALHTGAALPQQFHIVRTGLGAGKRDYATAGVLRAMLLEPAGAPAFDPLTQTARTQPAAPSESENPEPSILKLETNIDDCTGEALAFTLERLMEAGALDVYYTPIYMKKNRPAWMLTVLCSPEKRREMEEIIFRNTTTIGIRALAMDRTRLERSIISVTTPWGNADVKCCRFGEETRYYPENDSVSRLAKQENKGFGEMYRMIQDCAARLDS